MMEVLRQRITGNRRSPKSFLQKKPDEITHRAFFVKAISFNM